MIASMISRLVPVVLTRRRVIDFLTIASSVCR